MTEKQRRILKNVGKLAAYTAITGGSYILARGALNLLLSTMEPSRETTSSAKPPNEKAQSA